MEKPIIKIKINNTGFVIDPDNRVFRQVADPDNIVFFEDCRYRNGAWFVLWNRTTNRVYEGWRKQPPPSYVSELLIDFLDGGMLVRQTVVRTVQAIVDAVIHMLILSEHNGAADRGLAMCN